MYKVVLLITPVTRGMVSLLQQVFRVWPLVKQQIKDAQVGLKTLFLLENLGIRNILKSSIYLPELFLGMDRVPKIIVPVWIRKYILVRSFTSAVHVKP